MCQVLELNLSTKATGRVAASQGAVSNVNWGLQTSGNSNPVISLHALSHKKYTAQSPTII